MKRVIVLVLIAVFLTSGVSAFAAAKAERGGFMGFVSGCCFGIRSAGAYNDGKAWHMREWGLLIPFFQYYIMIMNGLDGANGITTSDLAAKYGAAFY
jgi:hypothetical protein